MTADRRSSIPRLSTWTIRSEDLTGSATHKLAGLISYTDGLQIDVIKITNGTPRQPELNTATTSRRASRTRL
jgi:hypothetical protein